jgi:hypothetical protein
MYQYSRAIYLSIKDLVDPYVTTKEQAEYRKEVLEACEHTMERLARDPQYFAKPERSLFQDIRRYFPITAQAQVAWAVNEGVTAACAFIQEQIRPARSTAASTLSRDDAQGEAVPAHCASERITARRTSTSSAPKSPPKAA